MEAVLERWPFVKVRLYDVGIAEQTDYWNKTDLYDIV